MTTQPMPWLALEAGLTVMMADGYGWEVVEHSAASVTVKRDGREPITRPLPTGEAQILLTPAARGILARRVERAESLLSELLGAVRVDLELPADAAVLRVPATWVNASSLESHIRLLHGEHVTGTKEADRLGLAQFHADHHANLRPAHLPHFIPHVHYDAPKEGVQ